jgi:hypothetical protein
MENYKKKAEMLRIYLNIRPLPVIQNPYDVLPFKPIKEFSTSIVQISAETQKKIYGKN